MIDKIAIVEWRPGDGLTRNFDLALRNLGFQTFLFRPGQPICQECKVVFSFGPYGNLMSILDKLNEYPAYSRPKFIYWDIEGYPDLRTPRFILYPLSAIRCWMEQKKYSTNPQVRKIMELYPLRFFCSRIGRFSNFGFYQLINRKSSFDLFIVSSVIDENYYRKHGIKAQRVPWGTSKYDYKEMNIERDIDVLWMGQRRGKRRTNLVNEIKKNIEQYGFKMLVVDGVESPYIFGEKRTEILNRSKITLNLLPYWDFSNFPYRFHLAAGNRCLVISEDFLPHFPEYKANLHFIQVPVKQLVDTIVYYIYHQKEREEIVENAYILGTKILTMENSMLKLMEYSKFLYGKNFE